MLVSPDNSTVVSDINKEGGTHSFEMCALMWRILAWSSAREIHIRARHIPGNLNVIADSLSRRDRAIHRMVSAPSGLSTNLPSLAQANGGSVCHQLECQTANLHISCPRRQDMADRCVEHLLGGSGRLCVLSSGHPAPVSSENGHYRCRVIAIAPEWLGMSWFWDLVELSTRIPLRLPQVHNLLKQPFSLRFHKNLEYLNLHAWFLDSCTKVKEDSLLRWQIELRHLRENPQGKCMIQGGPFFKSGPRRIRWISPNPLSLK